MSMDEFFRSLAKVTGADIVDNNHGWLRFGGAFEYEDGGCQGISRGLDMEFIHKLMGVFGVTKLRDIEGESCWVTHNHDDIKLIEPLHKKDGDPFDIHQWAEEAGERDGVLRPLRKRKEGRA